MRRYLASKSFSHETHNAQICFLLYSLVPSKKNLFTSCCQMFFINVQRKELHRHTCLEHDSSLRSNFVIFWSAQHNLLNSFINFPCDWKINYEFLPWNFFFRFFSFVFACLLYHSIERSTRRHYHVWCSTFSSLEIFFIHTSYILFFYRPECLYVL